MLYKLRPTSTHGFGVARRRLFFITLLIGLALVTLNHYQEEGRWRSFLDGNQTVTTRIGTTAKDAIFESQKTVRTALFDSQKAARKHVKDVHNSTLGFQKVLIVNLPDRTDKLDAIRLSASLSNFTFDVIPGIRGQEVITQALPGPFRKDPDNPRNGVVGCWRAHMNAANYIVQNRIATTLIIEDDSDWDISFRSQLEHFAIGSNHILGTPMGSPSISPYGDGWDLLWLGHCASSPIPGDGRRFLIENDPTVPPPAHRTNFGTIPNMTNFDNTTRLVFQANGGICTYSYALSYRGAQKLLVHLSMSTFANPIDIGLREMCKTTDRKFKCIAIFPQIIDSHRTAGNASKDSDMPYNLGSIREKAFSYNIVNSMRINADNLINHEFHNISSQWPDEVPRLKGPVRFSSVDDAP